MGEAPDFKLLLAAVNKLWSKKGQVRVSKKGSWYVFQFPDLSMMNWVLDMGPWVIGRKYLVLQKWRPDLTGTRMGMERMPLWVILRNLPMHLYNADGISHIASVIGTPLYMDKATANQVHLDFARICIEVQASKDIEESIKIDASNNEIVEVQVVIPWKPIKCDSCALFGHKCDEPVQQEEMQTESQEEKIIHDQEISKQENKRDNDEPLKESNKEEALPPVELQSTLAEPPSRQKVKSNHDNISQTQHQKETNETQPVATAPAEVLKAQEGLTETSSALKVKGKRVRRKGGGQSSPATSK